MLRLLIEISKKQWIRYIYGFGYCMRRAELQNMEGFRKITMISKDKNSC